MANVMNKETRTYFIYFTISSLLLIVFWPPLPPFGTVENFAKNFTLFDALIGGTFLYSWLKLRACVKEMQEIEKLPIFELTELEEPETESSITATEVKGRKIRYQDCEFYQFIKVNDQWFKYDGIVQKDFNGEFQIPTENKNDLILHPGVIYHPVENTILPL
ncbi:MAG: hypothetical protein QXN55_00205 [Candidatus Nitrosotenuis sp.]